MTKALPIVFALLLAGCGLDKKLPEEQKLFLTAKVWGFLKYYHPVVNTGQRNWDQELISVLHKLPAVSNEQELSALYLRWIDSLGTVEPRVTANSSAQANTFDKNFDLRWIRNSSFTDALRERLLEIERNRTERHHYIARGSVGQVEIVHEHTYTASQWSDRDIRLVTLFRYWNVIEYFYPYKYKMDQPWDEVLLRFIPRFMNTASETDYHLLLNELCVSLGDSHAFFVSDSVRAFAGRKYIAAQFKILNDKAILTSFYNDSLAHLDDLRLGDAVTKVDGIPVPDIYQRHERYITGSHPAVKKLSYSSRWISNGNTDQVRITFERNGQASEKTVHRYLYSRFGSTDPPPVKWKKLNATIGYANLEHVLAEDLPALFAELGNTRAIVFDLRNYPEFIIDELLAYLNPEPRGFAKFIQPDLTYPGRFEWTDVVECGMNNPHPYQGQTIILVNEETQSRGEYFAMALQTVDGAITIGRQTSGADGDVLDFTFFDDKTTWITGRGVFYPDGGETQRIGVRLDIEVPLTLEDISNGKDAILEKALETFVNGKNPNKR